MRQGELPVRAREGALGYDLGAPYQTIAARYTAGEHIVLPRKGKLHIPFALLHYFPRFHPGISESLPETPCRIVLPLRRLRRGRTADRTRLTAVLQPYQRALRWKR